MSWTIEPAGENARAAFDLALSMLSAADRAAAVDRAMRLLARGDLTPGGIWIAREGARVVGAMVGMTAAGGAGLVWPPQALDRPDRTEIEDALIHATIRWLRHAGVRLSQVLLRDEELCHGRPLLRHGFNQTTELLFLRHWLDATHVSRTVGSQLEFMPWLNCERSVFERSLLATYHGSLDCPELDGIRTVQQIIEGHQAQGRFDPDYWWLVTRHGQPAGVLLLNGVLDEPAWEIVYLGLVPVFRGHAMGAELVEHALEEAKLTRARFVDVTVDVRNVPARKLYAAKAFGLVERRHVLLRVERD